jgi:hypothetical protein
MNVFKNLMIDGISCVTLHTYMIYPNTHTYVTSSARVWSIRSVESNCKY